jgi:hypothetical protein
MRVLSLPPPCVRGSLPETERGGRRAPPRSKLSAGVDGPRRAVTIRVSCSESALRPGCWRPSPRTIVCPGRMGTGSSMNRARAAPADDPFRLGGWLSSGGWPARRGPPLPGPQGPASCRAVGRTRREAQRPAQPRMDIRAGRPMRAAPDSSGTVYTTASAARSVAEMSAAPRRRRWNELVREACQVRLSRSDVDVKSPSRDYQV